MISRGWRTAHALLVVALLLGLVGAGCSSGSGDNGGVAGSPDDEEPETRTAPLTGLETEADIERPALGFKIGLDRKARPLGAGITEADVVYEEVVEGGVTRLLAFFHSGDGTRIGPIRSVRPTDLDLVQPLGNAVLVASGGQPKVLRDVELSDVTTVIEDEDETGALKRVSDRRRPNDLYGATTPLWDAATDDDVPLPIAGYLDPEETTGDPDGPAPTMVTVEFSPPIPVEWKRGAETTRWTRLLGGLPELLDDGESTIEADNLVFVFVEGEDSGLRDVNDVPVLNWRTTGDGEAVVVRNDEVVRGTWERNTAESPFRLIDGQGEEILLRPGVTWWSLVPEDGSVTAG